MSLFCDRHGDLYMDFDSQGRPFKQPTCYSCFAERGEQGKKWELRLKKQVTPKTNKFYLTYIGDQPTNAFHIRKLRSRLMRLLLSWGKDYLELVSLDLWQMAPLVGKTPEDVLRALRVFEDDTSGIQNVITNSPDTKDIGGKKYKRGGSYESYLKEKDYDRERKAAQRLNPEQEAPLSLSDPAIVRLADQKHFEDVQQDGLE